MQYAAVAGHLGENYVEEVNSNRDIEFIQEICDACFDRDRVIGLFDTKEEAEKNLQESDW